MHWFNLYKSLGLDRIFDASWRSRWRKRQPQTPAPAPAPTPVQSNSPIEHYMNDPATPDLLRVVTEAPSTMPPVSVKNYVGGGRPRGSVEWQAANALVTVCDTLNYYASMSDKPLTKWAGTSVLYVLPRAGVDLNAFYNRRSMQFFYVQHPQLGSVYTVESADIVAHELGHAIFDSYRPDTWSVMSLEVASFHEAFADLTAMMHAMKYDEVLIRAVKETGGDMRKPSVITRLAEQMGQTIYKVVGSDGGRNPDCLRSAINNFKYANPGTLPEEAPHNQLAAECHSFGRVFLGAFWDLFVLFYEDGKASGKGPVVSMQYARDLLAKYTLKAVHNAPVNANFYQSFAKTMLWADVTLNNRKYHDRMWEVFANRNLVTQQLRMLSAPKCDNAEGVMKMGGVLNLKLSDVLISAQGDNPLYNLEIEVPSEGTYLYDNERNLYDVVACSDADAIGAAQDMINYLHKTKAVSDDPKSPFEVRDGKLIRTLFT